jgi:predicted porin
MAGPPAGASRYAGPMKNFTLLGALAIAGCAAHAQTGPVVIYGRLNVALEHMHASVGQDGRPASVDRESNDRSVLGFRGSEDLGGGMAALFQVEGTLAPDTGAGAIAARDTRIGLETPYGTVFGGNWVTPYNGATASLDPFYPTTAGYMSIMGNGSAPTTDNVLDTSSFDRRQRNSVHYWSPAWRGLALRIARGLNEERPASGAKPALTSAAVLYTRGPLYLTATYERHHDYQGPGTSDTGSKIGAAWDFGVTRLALVGERLRYETAAGSLARNAWYASATHQRGPHGLRVGVARAGDGKGAGAQRIGTIAAGPGTGATHATIGYDYTLSKRTSVFAYYTRLDNDSRGVYDFGINQEGGAPGATLQGTALGLRHNF